MTAFPWDQVMRTGLGVLRLSPDAFWRMTPRELAAALGGLQQVMPAAPDRPTLEALMTRFPDKEGSNA